ncbi:alkyl sulfatase dimerization domain-containing protein [Longirhabdus pacifica]|uniref:alkyl sulfatase dimerization domain-containing protein n=1 Tax=Longirhabdus pacifica TaxID=2305227 RepID=UPI001F0BA38D|nr:alkyl sulfatase dimerization domain-containing protein [Longirhabdus pacifica]
MRKQNKSRCAPVTVQELQEHSKNFEQGIVKVTDGVYAAIGYGLANSILLEGPTGTVIVDTMESRESAIPVKQAFDQITSKPLEAVIYTHFHDDHIGGTKVFTEGQDVDIYASAETVEQLNEVALLSAIRSVRSQRMFGTNVPEKAFINSGIGPFLNIDSSSTIDFQLPTKVFSDDIEIEAGGLTLQLLQAPGEATGEIVVYLPEKGVLISADDYYYTFPNIYTIRGTKYRSPLVWSDTMEKMRRLEAEYLVPLHTMPVYGKENIDQVLSNYRDALRFVHDQTVKGMNQGMLSDQLVEFVQLPPHLANVPYLKEFYGTTKWGVKNVFNGLLGWFDGNSTELCPLSLSERAMRIANMAGGPQRLLEEATIAYAIHDYQWVLELSDLLYQFPNYQQQAKQLKANALWQLGLQQGNANARNYYLTQALEITGKVSLPDTPNALSRLLTLEMDTIFKLLGIQLNASRSEKVMTAMKVEFCDEGYFYTVNVRKGVAISVPYELDDTQIEICATPNAWKLLVTGLLPPRLALLSKRVTIEKGTEEQFLQFLSLFDFPFDLSELDLKDILT